MLFFLGFLKVNFLVNPLKIFILIFFCFLSSKNLFSQEIPTKIANGTVSHTWPAVVNLVQKAAQFGFCSGVLVSCDTVLTAAHCVCQGSGRDCQSNGSQLLAVDEIEIFFQHGPTLDVVEILVPQGYQFGRQEDVAILRLSASARGIQPVNIEQNQRLGNNVATQIVGFGSSRERLTDTGIKRFGEVVTRQCPRDYGQNHICWRTQAQRPSANTCGGDSGGPQFLAVQDDFVLVGITSGGTGRCERQSLSINTEVFNVRRWITDRVRSPLGAQSCENWPSLVGNETDRFPVYVALQQLGQFRNGSGDRRFTVEVPTNARQLRISLNGERVARTQPLRLNDFDLFAHPGRMTNASNAMCRSVKLGAYEYCEIDFPTSGSWEIVVENIGRNQGQFQVTATIWVEPLVN